MIVGGRWIGREGERRLHVLRGIGVRALYGMGGSMD
jgi:hypothetical protein